MIKNHKGFTILEIIIVIGILSVLLLTLRNTFQYKQKDQLYAETCINKIFGDTNNFIYSAMTSRGLYKSGSLIFPEEYTINIDTTNNLISLDYTITDNSTGNYITNELGSISLKNYYCTNVYTTKLSGNNLTLNINRSVNQDQNIPPFTLSGSDTLFTGGTTVLLCNTGSNCKEIAFFEIDTRIQTIKKKKCLLIDNDSGLCTKRDQ